ncbi:MAG: tRNA lysidine(34) synthetase TilS [Sulfuritalea sp.]|jgi:tRNA(Ile)-lysidine synthase|nr:tRNA lysidine(34) synthetase TilS [Sulfuritalea sp.]MBK9350516.1 tRNA lysidine(34) synthetase TilS [Sulfuritalea sp.]
MAVSRNTPSVDPVVRAVSACISRHVATGESVVVGFSGGMDSSVLLDAANAVTREATIQLQAIHVHHGLSANADAWAEFCSDRCQSLKIPLDIVRVAVVPLRGEGVEAAARRCRHGILDSHPAQWKMLAHHADDQAETLLHNLLRGTGVRGAAAMPEMRGCLLRPLLSLTRKTLSEYATARKLQWIDDESNLDCRYTRNFLRASVFPSLTDRFPRGVEQLAAAAARFAEASTLLDNLARLDLCAHSPSFPMPLALLRELPEIRARNLLRAMLTWQGVQTPNESRLNEFVRQIRSAAHDRHPRLDVPAYSLWCAKGMLSFQILG